MMPGYAAPRISIFLDSAEFHLSAVSLVEEGMVSLCVVLFSYIIVCYCY